MTLIDRDSLCSCNVCSLHMWKPGSLPIGSRTKNKVNMLINGNDSDHTPHPGAGLTLRLHSTWHWNLTNTYITRYVALGFDAMRVKT
jgi:hypothetical protein